MCSPAALSPVLALLCGILAYELLSLRPHMYCVYCNYCIYCANCTHCSYCVYCVYCVY